MNLKTTYLGLKLANPIVVGAGPLTANVDSIKKLEENGAAAVVLPSIFEEQLSQESIALHYYTTAGSESYAEALDYFPTAKEYYFGPEEYLKLIRDVKAAVKIPVIASLNGYTESGWISFAKQIEDAGADALELNMYYLATDPNVSGADVERYYINTLKAVKKATRLPIAVKMSPFFSSIPAIAKELSMSGATGLVLFNRFYQPDFDLDKLDIYPNLQLSDSQEIRLSLRWIAVLYGKIGANLAATGGCHTAVDTIKLIMAGADSVQMVSSILKYGDGHIRTVLHGIEQWMTDHEYESIEQMKGSLSHKNVADPSAFERANYMKTLQSYKGMK